MLGRLINPPYASLAVHAFSKRWTTVTRRVAFVIFRGLVARGPFPPSAL